MTKEITYYLLKGHIYNKRCIERIVSVSTRDGDIHEILEEKARRFKEEWPEVITKVTWENL